MCLLAEEPPQIDVRGDEDDAHEDREAETSGEEGRDGRESSARPSDEWARVLGVATCRGSRISEPLPSWAARDSNPGHPG